MPASGTNVRVAYIEEVTPGTTPAGALTVLRDVDFRPGGNYETTQSAERQGSRNVQDLIRTSATGGFSFNHEMSFGNLDKQLESLYGNGWVADVLKVGTTKKTHTTEVQFRDISQYAAYKYSLYNDFTLSVAKGSIISGSMGAVSKFPVWSNATIGSPTTPIAAPTNAVMDPVGAVQLIQEGGSGTLGAREFSMHLSNGIITFDQLQSLDPTDYDYGQLKAEGSLSTYFADRALIDKWVAWTDTSLSFKLGGASIKNYTWLFSRVKLTNPRITGLSVNNAAIVQFDWQALDDATNTTSKITRVP